MLAPNSHVQASRLLSRTILLDSRSKRRERSQATEDQMTGNQTALAINGRFLGQPISGVQRYARELIRALDRALTRTDSSAFSSVTVWVPPNTPATAFPSELQSLKIKRTGHFTGHLWEQLELPRVTRDAILVNLTNSAPLLHPRQLVTIHDAAIVVFPDDFKWTYRLWYRALYAALRRTPARFISVSAFAASQIAQHFKIAADRIDVVFNAAEHFITLEPDQSVLKSLKFADRSYILAVGSRAQRKNVDVIERALVDFSDRPALVIAGGGASRAFAPSKNDPKFNSVLLDHVSDSAIKALYQGALCLVFPSRYEGFGLPPLEAMACGCPVIVASAASMPEICGEAALYCDPDRPDTVAANVRRLMTEPSLRGELIARGTQRAQQFSWERSAAALLENAGRLVKSGN
jgi:glycosyltransferase involved in cell wall biosynthesis